mmetsp:Transcript_22275/g.61798  ORF Transcript_22275/g.61798 Transcript_22275/m.61798 type:complete len:303 (-) Transcript_22275:1181-2089(-)
MERGGIRALGGWAKAVQCHTLALLQHDYRGQDACCGARAPGVGGVYSIASLQPFAPHKQHLLYHLTSLAALDDSLHIGAELAGSPDEGLHLLPGRGDLCDKDHRDVPLEREPLPVHLHVVVPNAGHDALQPLNDILLIPEHPQHLLRHAKPLQRQALCQLGQSPTEADPPLRRHRREPILLPCSVGPLPPLRLLCLLGCNLFQGLVNAALSALESPVPALHGLQVAPRHRPVDQPEGRLLPNQVGVVLRWRLVCPDHGVKRVDGAAESRQCEMAAVADHSTAIVHLEATGGYKGLPILRQVL